MNSKWIKDVNILKETERQVISLGKYSYIQNYKGLTSKYVKNLLHISKKSADTHTSPSRKMGKIRKQKNYHMTNKLMKRCLASLVIKEMQITATMKCHFTFI